MFSLRAFLVSFEAVKGTAIAKNGQHRDNAGQRIKAFFICPHFTN
jgi:hypothetical protein